MHRSAGCTRVVGLRLLSRLPWATGVLVPDRLWGFPPAEADVRSGYTAVGGCGSLALNILVLTGLEGRAQIPSGVLLL